MPITSLLEQQPGLTRTLPLLAEQDRVASTRARELGLASPVWRLTFKPLIRGTAFSQRLREMMDVLEAAYQHPVDIEFTLHLDQDGEPHLNLVQCRPLATLGTARAVKLPAQLATQQLLFHSEGHFMGGNIDLAIDCVIRVQAAAYARLSRAQKYQLAREIGALVRARNSGHNRAQRIMLIGPGRWGTSSPELGVPVRFADIAGISVLVEVAEKAQDMVPDLSYGSHFFQDLVESGIAYIALFPEAPDCDYQPQRLAAASRRCSLPDTIDPEIAAALDCHWFTDKALQLMADVVQQKLVCYFDAVCAPETTGYD